MNAATSFGGNIAVEFRLGFFISTVVAYALSLVSGALVRNFVNQFYVTGRAAGKSRTVFSSAFGAEHAHNGIPQVISTVTPVNGETAEVKYWKEPDCRFLQIRR